MKLKTTLREAIEVAQAHPAGSREIVAHAIILGAYLKMLQANFRDCPGLPTTEAADLLQMFVKRHGIPHNSPVLVSIPERD